MSSILDSDVERTKMSPLDDIKSPTSVESELMVADMLDEHHDSHHSTHHHHHHDHHLHQHHQQHSVGLGGELRKRKREEEDARKLPSLASNNNDVSFVLEDQSADDPLHDDTDDVSCFVVRRIHYVMVSETFVY